MKNKWKLLLSIAASCLFVGLILLTVGIFTGGIKEIAQLSTPKKAVKTFDDINNISLRLHSGQVTVKQGKTDKLTVSYYTGGKFLPNVALKTESNTLTISSKSPKVIISGPMEGFGYTLSQAEATDHYRDITITIPKGMTLEQLTAPEDFYHFAPLHIQNLTIKNLEYPGRVELTNTTLESANLMGVELNKSTLKNARIEYAYGSPLLINRSTLENVTILKTSPYQKIVATDSTLKQVKIDSQLPEYDTLHNKRHQTYGTSYYGLIETHNTNFEELTIHSTSSLRFKNSTFIGSNLIKGNHIDGHISLKTGSHSTTALDIQGEQGRLALNKNFPNAETFTATKEPINFKNTIEKPSGNLTIQAKYLDHFSLE